LSQEEQLSSLANFSVVLRDAVKKGLTVVLGETGAKATLFHLNLSGSDYEDPAKFHRKLQELFTAGTPSLEKIIVSELDETLKSPLRSIQESGFVKSVLDAKRAFIAEESRRRTR